MEAQSRPHLLGASHTWCSMHPQVMLALPACAVQSYLTLHSTDAADTAGYDAHTARVIGLLLLRLLRSAVHMLP